LSPVPNGPLILAPASSAVLDVVYDPRPTPLASAAAHSGIVAVSGFDLLLHQAARPGRADDRPPAPWNPCAPPATPN
jgi:shikimate 5-dehydrogenase